MSMYGFSAYPWGPGIEFDRVVGDVALAGFAICELWAADCRFDDVPKMRRAMNAHGVWARTLHPPIPNTDLASDDEATRQRSLRVISACFEPFAATDRCAMIWPRSFHDRGNHARVCKPKNPKVPTSRAVIPQKV